RAVILPAIAVALASTLVFLFADRTAWLFLARVLSGFSTGLAAGATTAWIVELLRHAGKSVAARTASGANFAGLASGPLLTGAAATVVATNRVPSRKAMFAGLATFVACVAMLVLAQALESLWLLLAATAMAGIAGALGYRGSLEVVNLIAPGDQRSEVTSSYLM